jgi:hypothetical protein
VESEDKIVPVVIGALGTVKRGSDQLDQTFSCFQVIVSHRATEDHANEHCTHHS